jgi:hypothetical protein
VPVDDAPPGPLELVLPDATYEPELGSELASSEELHAATAIVLPMAMVKKTLMSEERR